MSVSCHNQTHAPQQSYSYSITSSALASKEVGARPSPFGGLEVDDEVRTRSAVHREIVGFGPFNILSTPQSATPQTPSSRAPRRAHRPPQPFDRSCHARCGPTPSKGT